MRGITLSITSKVSQLIETLIIEWPIFLLENIIKIDSEEF